MYELYLCHHGIKGQKWGVRRYQNENGTLTYAGEKRYNKDVKKLLKKANKSVGYGTKVAIDVVTSSDKRYTKPRDKFRQKFTKDFEKTHGRKPKLREINKATKDWSKKNEHENVRRDIYNETTHGVAARSEHYKAAKKLVEQYGKDSLDAKNRKLYEAMEKGSAAFEKSQRRIERSKKK